MLEDCERNNDRTYHEVCTSGLGALKCLGAEVYGRMSRQCIELIPELARERSRGLHPRLRKSVAFGLQHRWSGILAISLQRAVANIVSGESADITQAYLEPTVAIADLVMV